MELTAIAREDLESKGFICKNEVKLVSTDVMEKNCIQDVYACVIGRKDLKTGKLESYWKKDIENNNTEELEKILKNSTTVAEKYRNVINWDTGVEREVLDYYIPYDIKESSKNRPTVTEEYVVGCTDELQKVQNKKMEVAVRDNVIIKSLSGGLYECEADGVPFMCIDCETESKHVKTKEELEHTREKAKKQFALHKFVEEMTKAKGLHKPHFDLMRLSKEKPYWCVFANEHDKCGASMTGGHYCIGDENIQDVLTVIAESGWGCTVDYGYFQNAN